MNEDNLEIVYLVISPDREPVAIFSKEEFSDDFIELYADEGFGKEVMLLDAARRYKPPKGKDVYRVKTNRLGTEVESKKVQRTFFNISVIGIVSYDADGYMNVNMWANDHVEAKHMTNGLRSEAINNNRWGLVSSSV